MGGVTNDIDNLGAVHFDVEARRRKQQVSCDKSVGFNLDLRPNPLRRSPLRSRNKIRKPENTPHLFGKPSEGAAALGRQSHTGLDAIGRRQRGELWGAQ